MEVFVAENAGFCFGVKRAVKMAFDAAENYEGKVHSLGPLIHNPQVVERLTEKGVQRVEALTQIEEGVVILRSHGVSSPQVIEDAEAQGLHIIDATCPFVTNAQKYAKQLVDEGYQVVMVGDRHHPESQSVLGHAGGEILVTEEFEEIKKMMNKFSKKRIGIISQTTQTYGKFSEIVVRCLQICEEVKVFNTICYATEDRQTEAQGMAEKVEAMVVVGGKNSANTTHLADICREKGIRVYHIETVREIEEGWFSGIQKVGVTAGASTPDWIINEVVEHLKKL
jgi:small subunit ribosomal protein S1